MYKKLTSLGVSFAEESFIDLQPRTGSQESGVITQDKNGIQHVYPAAYVFDCSGKEAVVAQAVNRYQEKSNQAAAFTSTPLVDINPITNHLVAHVKISNHRFLNDFASAGSTEPVPMHYKQVSPEKNISIREELQKMGWSFEAFPTFYTYSQSGTDKLCLYMESPLNLPKQKQKEWINLMLRINSREHVSSYVKLKKSTTYEFKPRIMQFKSEPHVLNRAAFERSDLPTVLVGFDALKGFDYRTASGVDSGIDCFELMLNHIEIENGLIKHIDLQRINQSVSDYIHGEYKKALVSRLADRQNSINNGHEYFSRLYEKAAATLPASESKKKEYNDTAAQLAKQSATTLFSLLESRDKDKFKSIDALNKCLGAIIRAKTLLSASDTEGHHVINNNLQKVIQYLRLEIAALDIEAILAEGRVSRQRLTELCKSVKDNFNQLEGSFAHNTVQNKITALLERINRSSPSASLFMGTSATSLLGSPFPFLLTSLLSSPRSAPVPAIPSFFPSRAPTSTQGARSLISLILISSLLSSLDDDNEEDIPLTLSM
ncbi:hypothetical protein [Legionella birminghamensis]|nr:hypothetical protein [Legionella birminghamensis]